MDRLVGTPHVGEDRGDRVLMTRALAPKIGVPLEYPEPEPIRMALENPGHHHRRGKNRCNRADQTSRDDNAPSKQPFPTTLPVGIDECLPYRYYGFRIVRMS